MKNPFAESFGHFILKKKKKKKRERGREKPICRKFWVFHIDDEEEEDREVILAVEKFRVFSVFFFLNFDFIFYLKYDKLFGNKVKSIISLIWDFIMNNFVFLSHGG